MAHDNVTRRQFIERTAAAGAGLVGAAMLGTGELTGTQQAPKLSRVALIRSQSVMAADSQPRLDKLLEMLDIAVQHVFDTDNVQQAWEQVAASDDVVAIKVNCIGPHLNSSVPVVQAVTTRLIDLGIPANNIIVFDRTTEELRKAGFPVQTEGDGVRIYGTDGDYDEPINHRSFHHRLTKIITQRASAIINIPVLKNHARAGVTLAMKNHYGSIDNPAAYHGEYDNCDPYIADVNDIPAIKNKTRLIVCDATRGCWDGGPWAWSWHYLGLQRHYHWQGPGSL